MARRVLAWTAEVLKKLHGKTYPLSKTDLKKDLGGVHFKGLPIEKIIDAMDVKSVESPADLLHQFSVALKKLEESGQA